MKTLKITSLFFALTIGLFFTSCDDDIEKPGAGESIVPEKFSVDIPSSISATAAEGRRIANGRTAEEELDGNNIYEAMSLFIYIGESSGDLVEAIINTVGELGIDRAMSISFESDEDGRAKNLQVVEGVSYEGVEYEFMLTVTDADSEGNDDEGKALQVLWSRNPVKGVSILKPYNINRLENPEPSEATYRIDYSEAGDLGYDAHMTVYIVNLPLENPLDDPYSVDNLKMFVGKKGEVVDVYGNSNHPNAKFFTADAGFNWAFVASGKENENIGVAEVGLPPSSLEATDRSVLLEDYSIKSVFSAQILAVWPGIEQSLLDQYLFNTEGPGFFGNDGFIQGGTSPGSEYDELLERIDMLAPYSPASISTLEISFK